MNINISCQLTQSCVPTDETQGLFVHHGSSSQDHLKMSSRRADLDLDSAPPSFKSKEYVTSQL